MRDLEVQDRLDAMIDKCLKRLLFLRGLKSISASSPLDSGTPCGANENCVTNKTNCLRGQSSSFVPPKIIFALHHQDQFGLAKKRSLAYASLN